LKDLVEKDLLPDEATGSFHTLGMHFLEHIPKSGEHFKWSGLRFEVMDMDGTRVDKILVTPLPLENVMLDNDLDS
jgi:putative hemolysin